jgi:hypothetical protein
VLISVPQGIIIVMRSKRKKKICDLSTSGIFFDLPASLEELQKELLGDYKHSAMPPAHIKAQELICAETLSLEHYVAWKKSNGTVLAYNFHAQVLQSEAETEILPYTLLNSLLSL